MAMSAPPRCLLWFLKFARAPGLSGGRGEMATSSARLAFLRGVVCARRRYARCFPFLFPVQRQSSELPATTVGECRRRHSLRRHKGGLWTVLFKLPATTCYRVALTCRCQAFNRTAVALVATGPRQVASGLSVVVEWQFHSRQAGTPRGRAEERRAPTQGLAGDIFYHCRQPRVLLGLGIPVLGAAWLPVTYSWLPSLPLLRSSAVFRLFSAFLLSSIFFSSD